MARALRSSGAVTDPATAASVATANGTPRSRVLKRKRTDDEHHPSPRPTAPGDSDGPGDSASPLTDLAPSPAVKHEVLDDPPPPSSDKQPTRSPTPGPFRDGSDAPLTPADAHKLLTVLEMFDTQNLLARHVPSSELSLRAMLKTSTHSLRAVRAAVATLAPVQSQSRAAPSLELAAQRSFCELALGLIDEIAQKHLVSKDRTSIYQVSAEHKSKHRAEEGQPVRFALQQTIHGVDYYTGIADDALTPQKAASLATGQASLTAIIPSLPIAISSMPTLGAYSRKVHVPPPPPPHTFPGMLELSYGSRASFAPTYDSSGSGVTRVTVDSLAARRLFRKFGAMLGPPPLLSAPGAESTAKDTEMVDVNAGTQSKQNGILIHPDLVPIPIDPSLTSTSLPTHLPSPPTESKSTLEPDSDPDLARALDELGLEDSVRGLLQSNARAMAQLVDLQNKRLRRWDGKDMSVLDAGEGEERDLANAIEKTLGMLAALRPRTVLASVPPTTSAPTPTSLIPPASVLRALHRTLPTEAAPGYRGTLDIRKEMALKDNTTIKVANVPVPPAVPQAGTPVSAAKAGTVPRPTVYPAYPGQQAYGAQYPVQQYPAGAAGVAGQQATYPYPYQYAGASGTTYPTPTAGQATYPTPVIGQTGYPTPGQAGYPTPGQTTYPTPGQATTYPAPVPGQAATYPAPAVAGVSTPRVITNVVKPVAQGVWSPGQGYTSAGVATPTSAVGTTGYNPSVSATGYNPSVNATGYNPSVNATGYNPSVSATGYNPSVNATGYNPAVPAYAPGGYVATPTPIKPIAAATPARGPIPAHVRSTPGTPASPAAYLPSTNVASTGVGVGTTWNGTGPRPT